jgi:nicotinate phosphoribosyltransferase
MGIPIFGTMAHSFVEAHDDETAAFERFAESAPQNTVLLIDTYDTEAAARKVVALAPRLAQRGIRVKGVRLDSGDLAALARSVRRILDEGGLSEATIFASGNIDEYRIRDLLSAGAPIDGFGVGTSLVTSSDAPYLDAVYKLQEYAGRARRKRSTGKATWPGRKQVYRHYDRAGRFEHDVITVEGDERAGEPLIVPVMRNGRRLHAAESLAAIRERAAVQLAKLPERLRALESAPTPHRVEFAPALRHLAAEVDRATGETPALLR